MVNRVTRTGVLNDTGIHLAPRKPQRQRDSHYREKERSLDDMRLCTSLNRWDYPRVDKLTEKYACTRWALFRRAVLNLIFMEELADEGYVFTVINPQGETEKLNFPRPYTLPLQKRYKPRSEHRRVRDDNGYPIRYSELEPQPTPNYLLDPEYSPEGRYTIVPRPKDLDGYCAKPPKGNSRKKRKQPKVSTRNYLNKDT
jgi:hypothetical protein